MALSFNNGVDDRVVIASAASIDDLDPFTAWGWYYVLGKTSSDRLHSKPQATGNKELVMTGVVGNLWATVGRASGSTSYVTNNTPLGTNNKWYFIAWTFDSAAGAGQVVNLYVGDLTTAAAECTYSTATDGSGSVYADNGNSLYIGNTNTNSRSFPGHIASFGLVARVLTPGEIHSLQWRPRVVPDTRLYMELGHNGTGTQPDWSGNGNGGTVTAATQVAHVPRFTNVFDQGFLASGVTEAPPPSAVANALMLLGAGV